MNEENKEPWSEEQIEEWEHDKWLEMQEMGGEIYKPDFKFLKEDETEDIPFEEEKRRKWQKEEEQAKEAYFKEIEKEEERGYFRKNNIGTNRGKKSIKKVEEEKGEGERRIGVEGREKWRMGR